MNPSSIDWQTISALLIVAGAIMILFCRVINSIMRQSTGAGCGACTRCPAQGTTRPTKTNPLVQLKRSHE